MRRQKKKKQKQRSKYKKCKGTSLRCMLIITNQKKEYCGKRKRRGKDSILGKGEKGYSARDRACKTKKTKEHESIRGTKRRGFHLSRPAATLFDGVRRQRIDLEGRKKSPREEWCHETQEEAGVVRRRSGRETGGKG